MTEYLTLGLFIFAMLNISVWPPLIYFQNRQIIDRVNRLIVTVSDSDDPDPADENETVEQSNIVAIGKRAA